MKIRPPDFKVRVLILRPALGQYLPVLCEQLAPEYVSVCNNASWAIGEVAVKVRPLVT